MKKIQKYIIWLIDRTLQSNDYTLDSDVAFIKLNKPYSIIDSEVVFYILYENFIMTYEKTITSLKNSLSQESVQILNIAGSRESSCPGIEKGVKEFIEHVLG